MAIIGRAPRKFTFPPDHETWIELRKLSGPEKIDFRDALATSAVAAMEYLWTHAVVGFRLNTDQGIVNWPDPQHPQLFRDVLAGLEDDEHAYILAAAYVQNDLLAHHGIRGNEALLKVGWEALPETVINAIANWDGLTQEQQKQAMADIDSIVGPDPGDTLGNSGASSGQSGASPDEAPSATGTQEPVS